MLNQTRKVVVLRSHCPKPVWDWLAGLLLIEDDRPYIFLIENTCLVDEFRSRLAESKRADAQPAQLDGRA